MLLLRDVARFVPERLHGPLERGPLENIQAAIQLVPEPLLLLRELGQRLSRGAAAQRVCTLIEPTELVAHLGSQCISQQLLCLVQSRRESTVECASLLELALHLLCLALELIDAGGQLALLLRQRLGLFRRLVGQ